MMNNSALIPSNNTPIKFLSSKLFLPQPPLEASRIVYEKPIGLVFTDVFMPEMNGVELVQMLGNKCKVIFITAYTDYEVRGYKIV